MTTTNVPPRPQLTVTRVLDLEKKLALVTMERDALRERLRILSTCVVCHASLYLGDEHVGTVPPHCEDCVPGDDHICDWEMHITYVIAPLAIEVA